MVDSGDNPLFSTVMPVVAVFMLNRSPRRDHLVAQGKTFVAHYTRGPDLVNTLSTIT